MPLSMACFQHPKNGSERFPAIYLFRTVLGSRKSENGSERFRTVQNGSWTILFRPSRLARTVQNGSCDGWFGALLQEPFVVVRYHLSFYWWKQKVGLNFLDQQNPFEFCVEVASSHKLITAHHIVGFWWFLRRRKQRTRNDTQKYSDMF